MIRLIALAVTWRGDRSAQLRSVVLALSVAARHGVGLRHCQRCADGGTGQRAI